MLVDLDLIQLRTGEVLSVVGTYAGSLCRARLTYVPDPHGGRVIGRQQYAKLGLRRYGPILKCPQLLDLPGEEHYLVDWSSIDSVFTAKEGFRNLNDRDHRICADLIQLLSSCCRVGKDQHGLGGSSAAGCRLPGSDFDWIIYDHRKIGKIEGCLAGSASFTPSWPFSADHVTEKYEGITSLSSADVMRLFLRRRRHLKYFKYRDGAFSLNFVSTRFLADGFLFQSREGRLQTTSGALINAEASHLTPKLLTMRTAEGLQWNILSWLFLYSGAFRPGDIVEVRGEVGRSNHEDLLFVDRKEHYIKLLSPES